MSVYTTEVRFICENAVGYTESKGYQSVNDILNAAAPKIFDFDFPMWDENYRKALEIKILRHFYTREIGMETVGLWKLKLEDRLNMIMPYYNELYKTTVLEFNPLYDVDVMTVYEGSGNKDENGQKKLQGSTDSTTNVDKSVQDNTTDTTTGSERETDNKTANQTNQETKTENDYKQGNEQNYAKADSEYNDYSSSDTDTTTNQMSQNTNTRDTTTTRTPNLTQWDAYSDTPQGALTNVENNTYLTNARKIENTGNEKTVTTESEDLSGMVDTTGKTGVVNTATGTVDNLETNESNSIETGTKEIIGNQNVNGTEDVTKNKTLTNERTIGNDRTETNATTGNTTINNTETNSNIIKSTDEYIKHVSGKQGTKTYMQMIQELRANILNIDRMIINDLESLFMLVY